MLMPKDTELPLDYVLVQALFNTRDSSFQLLFLKVLNDICAVGS